jgi:hypothetical protein
VIALKLKSKQCTKEDIIMNKTVAELRIMAKELGVKGYSKLSKAELMKTIACKSSEGYLSDYEIMDLENEMPEDVSELLSEELVITQEDVEVKKDAQPERILNNSEVKDFVNKYKGFTLYESLRGNAPYARQINLAKAIENNFEIKIPVSTYKTAGELSDDLSKALKAIDNGSLKARPKTEVAELVKAYKPTVLEAPKPVKNGASEAQIKFINKLEKETGVINTRVVDSVKTANEIIQHYLALKNSQVKSEVAVDAVNTVQEKLASPSFRTKFVAFLKRALA